jgi:hypothetical protein
VRLQVSGLRVRSAEISAAPVSAVPAGQGRIPGYWRTGAVRSGCGCERSFVFIGMEVAYWRTGAVRGAGTAVQAVDSAWVKHGFTVPQRGLGYLA